LTAAETEFLELRRRVPDFAPAAYSLGLLYGTAGRWNEAVESLRDCRAIDASYPGALTDLAHAYVKLGEAATALDLLERAATVAETGPEAMRALIDVNLELGNREAARRWAVKATKDDPGGAPAARLRAPLAEQESTEGQ
jgi:tetratricopeptide (TPR) repeat protein